MANSQNLSDGYGITPENSWPVSQISSNPPPLTPRTDSVHAVKNFVNKHMQLKVRIKTINNLFHLLFVSCYLLL